MGAVFRLNPNTFQVKEGTKIIKADEYAKYVEASGIVETAKSRAHEIEQEALEAYEQKKQEGYNDGLEEGKMEHAEKVMETILSSVEFIESIENTLVDIVNEAIRKIIGEMEQRDRIVAIVKNALNSVRGQQKVIVRVNPDDEHFVSEALAAMIKSGSASSFLTILADTRLEKNSCILESELGVVDASLKTQIKAFENAFKNKIRS